MANALLGAVTLVGESPTPRYQGPLERLSREAGRPMGPSTPLWSSQSCAVFVSISVLVIWGRSLGNVKRIVALRLLSWFSCPLSFWPCSFICLVSVGGISVSRMIVFFFVLLLFLFLFLFLLKRQRSGNRPHAHTYTLIWTRGGLLFCVHIAAFVFTWSCFFFLPLCHRASCWLRRF